MDQKMAAFRNAIQQDVFRHRKDGAVIMSENNSLEELWLFDFRALILQAEWIDYFATLFWERYGGLYPFQVGGLETAGIPLVAAVVMKSVERKTPVNGFYIRKSRKRDGLMKRIEGKLNEYPVILVDDLINRGQTLNQQIQVLEEEGKKITDAFCILLYRNQEAYRFASDKGIRIISLFTLEDFDIPLLSPSSREVPRSSFQSLWRFQSGQPGFNYVVEKSAPIIHGNKLFFGSDRGIMWALNQENGSTAWSYRVGLHPKGKGIFSTPAIAQQTLYFGAYDGNVYALDFETGRRKWVHIEADWVGSSPSLAPSLDLLFIGLEFGLFKKRGGVVALSLTTGKKKWEHRMPMMTHSSPLYIEEEKAVVIGSNDGIVYCFEAENGKLRWKYQTRGDIKASFAYDKKRKAALFGSFDGGVYSLSMKDGALRWTFQAGAGIFSTPLVSGNVVYIPSLDKNLYALSAEDGSKKWSFSTSGRIFASPVLAASSLWIGSNDGRLYEIAPENGKLRSFFQTTERIVNAIAYNEKNELLFLPTFANEIYCLRKEKGEVK